MTLPDKNLVDAELSHRMTSLKGIASALGLTASTPVK